MNGWAILYLVLICIGWAVSVARHGQPREPYNAGMASALLALILLLWWLAGFFQ